VGAEPEVVTDRVVERRTGSSAGRPTRHLSIPRMNSFERGAGEPKPHEREWPKHATGPGEAQPVKVVRNGEGGPKRAWNPATRRAQEGPSRKGRAGQREPGSGFSRLGALEGRRTSREVVREAGAVFGPAGTNGRGTDEVLEGDCKTMGGSTAGWATVPTAVERKTPGSTPQGAKDAGGAAKPDERLRFTVWGREAVPGPSQGVEVGSDARRVDEAIREYRRGDATQQTGQDRRSDDGSGIG
jgi:hypothetical protein